MKTLRDCDKKPSPAHGGGGPVRAGRGPFSASFHANALKRKGFDCVQLSKVSGASLVLEILRFQFHQFFFRDAFLPGEASGLTH